MMCYKCITRDSTVDFMAMDEDCSGRRDGGDALGVIDYRDSRAIYEQIAAYYEKLILSGVLREDEQMPSVRSLAMELSTNPNTVQKAYARLEKDGFIYSVKGRGNFVCNAQALLKRRRGELRERMAEIIREARDLGLDAEAIFGDAMG